MKKYLKRGISLGLSLSIVFSSMFSSNMFSYAQADTRENEWVFSESTDSTTGQDNIILAYNGESKIVNIPETLNGRKVEAIGENVFKDKGLTEVNIPEGITYIGKNAFKGNRISEVNIPDSVTTIKEGAFEQVNNIYFSKTKITGMKGITSLSDASFANIENLSMEIPSLEHINQNAFYPTPTGSRSYILLYTKEYKNEFHLESLDNLYLIDPAKIIVEAVDDDSSEDEENKIVLSRAISTSEYGTSYPYTTNASDFYKIGDSIDSIGPKEEVLGYAMPDTTQALQLEEPENVVSFAYKPIWVEAPLAVAESETEISGKVSYENANIELYSRPANRTGAAFVKEKDVQAEGEEFTLSDLSLTRDKVYKIKANVRDDEYEGSSIDYYFAVGDVTIEGVKKPAPLSELLVKEGENIAFPRTVNLELSNDTTKTFKVTWKNAPTKIEEAGTYWYKGQAFDYDINDEQTIPVYVKVVVSPNDDLEKTDKTVLIRTISEARGHLSDTIVSVDGSDVFESTRWVTKEEHDELEKAIQASMLILNDNTVNQDVVENTIQVLERAISTFLTSKKVGTKKDATMAKGSVVFYVTEAGLTEDNKDDFVLKLKRVGDTDRQAKLPDSIKSTDTGIEYKFEDLNIGTWDLVPPESYIATVAGNRAGRDITRMEITYDEQKIIRFVSFDKGLRVHYDLGEHGTSDDPTDVYYINGEHWDALPLPVVLPKAGWKFIGWSDDGGVNIKIEHRAIISNENLTAIYKRNDDDGVDESTSIGTPWVLGDFTYEKDTAVGKEDEWVVTGFSSQGLQKSTKYFNLILPHITPSGDDVKAIGASAFENKEIDSVEIPDGIERIYSHAFYETNLTRLVLPNSIEIVGNNAFLRCKLAEVVFSDSLTRINDGAFAENKLRTLDLPDSLTRIEATAFADNMIENVDIKEGVNFIGKRAFYHNALKEVKIPLTLQRLEDDAFEGNPGRNDLKSKVALYTEDFTNPHNLKDGKGHIINPPIRGKDSNDKKMKLLEMLQKVQRLSNDSNVSEDGTDVANDEYYIDETLKDKVKQALYEGYYAYYDDSTDVEGSEAKYSVEIATKGLEKVEELIKNNRALGTGKPLEKGQIVLTIGIDGIEYDNDITEEHEFTLKDVTKPNSKAYRWKTVQNTAPHTAWLSWNLSDGKYKFEVPVGKVLAYQDGMNGKMKPEKNPYIKVRNLRLVEGEDTEDFGFGMEDGVVFIYDLMDGGSSEDLLYETQMRNYSPVNIPKVVANSGTRLKGWSLDGETVLDLSTIKAEGNLIFKAVYEEGDEIVIDTKSIDDEIKNAVDALSGATVSIDGNGISADKKWTTQEEFTKLEEVIERAKEEKKKVVNDKEVNQIVLDLKKAIKNFNSSLKSGLGIIEKIDKETLKRYIDLSEKLIEKTKIAESDSALSPNDTWIEKEFKDKLYYSLVEANFVYEDEKANMEDIERALTELKLKYNEFKNNIKVKKESSKEEKNEDVDRNENSGNSGNSGSSGNWNGGSSSSRGSFGKGGVSSSRQSSLTKSTSFDLKNTTYKTYEVNKDGRWLFTKDGSWYFIDNSGKVLNNTWAKIYSEGEDKNKNNYYHFSESGKLETGWISDKQGNWYYLSKKGEGTEGKMKEGWYFDKTSSNWYYLEKNTGKMLKSWVQIDGVWYFFEDKTGRKRPEGALYVNEMTPDFYFVDTNGRLIK